ncbi:protein NKG7-like isoform X1 [Hemicordylus capensis]|uniref:protein NKG7-like isoform X1 n=1 Tax=Hemicordylus capensis TaxID=884348 RepID=UPI002304C603|nr:protein NKG7-like isoform X1 [Hemicordylus capensis]
MLPKIDGTSGVGEGEPIRGRGNRQEEMVRLGYFVFRNPFSFVPFSLAYSQPTLTFLTQPLRIGSVVCSSASLLLLLTSLCTSYWLLESTSQGLVHGGLWEICLGPDCKIYPFGAIAPFLHASRAFLIMATLLGISSLSCSCVAFSRCRTGPVSLDTIAAGLSFGAGICILVSMAVFTISYWSANPFIQNVIIFGSSYGAGWVSFPMYTMTSGVIITTYKTTCPDYGACSDIGASRLSSGRMAGFTSWISQRWNI